ncbi:MAG: OmpA family protein [Saprospiraceae bacterium]|nr:OmpA family protein [Saprospiraceae bacterium]
MHLPTLGGQWLLQKQVVKTAARMDEIEIPAEYATIKKQVVDRPADVKRVTVEPEYVTVSKTEIVKKGGVTYTEIDCKLVNYSSLPILYNLGSAALTNEAKSIIDNNIYEMMVGKPEISVEIASHTDARGDDNSNLSLSQRRAESVVNYLVSKGSKEVDWLQRIWRNKTSKQMCQWS